jgi:hypothetical protein
MTPQLESASPFRAGAVVIATLANPREKFWGAILHLSPIGLSLRGVDLSSFDDFTAQIRDGEPFAAGVMFFPMHRLERLELDLPEGSLPSLAQRFAQKTGQDPAPILVGEFLPASADDAVQGLCGADILVRPSATSEEETQLSNSSPLSLGQEHPYPRAAKATAPGTPNPRQIDENPPQNNPPGDSRP